MLRLVCGMRGLAKIYDVDDASNVFLGRFAKISFFPFKYLSFYIESEPLHHGQMPLNSTINISFSVGSSRYTCNTTLIIAFRHTLICRILNSNFSHRWTREWLAKHTLSSALKEIFSAQMQLWYDPLDNKALKILIIEQFHNPCLRQKLTEALFKNEYKNFVRVFDHYLPKKAQLQLHPNDLAEDLLSFVIWLRSQYFIFSGDFPDKKMLQKKIDRKIKHLQIMMAAAETLC